MDDTVCPISAYCLVFRVAVKILFVNVNCVSACLRVCVRICVLLLQVAVVRPATLALYRTPPCLKKVWLNVRATVTVRASEAVWSLCPAQVSLCASFCRFHLIMLRRLTNHQTSMSYLVVERNNVFATKLTGNSPCPV